MFLCNVDFFDFDRTTPSHPVLKNLHHDVISDPNFEEDYLTPNTNKIEIFETVAVSKNNLVYITGDFTYLGIVTDVSNDDMLTIVTFKPFIALFDQDVMFDTDCQKNTTQSTKSLENTLKNLINQYWISTGDTHQNMPINVTVSTETLNWNFKIESNYDDSHYAIVNLYDALIAEAMRQYGIMLVPRLNFTQNRVDISIKKTSASVTIDANLDTVGVNTFTINAASSTVNKLEIWNTANFTQKIYYYLHPNHTFDTSNTNRMTPVILAISDATPDDDHTFAQAAAEVAQNEFGGIVWENEIELVVDYNDTIVNPTTLEIGQQVVIIYGLQQVTSILTGRSYGDDVTLTFGTVRTKLTKLLKRTR